MWTNRNIKLGYFFFGALIHMVLYFMPFQFQTNDDSRMMRLVEGKFSGNPGDYAVYLHPILSEVIGSLYYLNSGILWYPLLWFLFFYLSYMGYVMAVMKKVSSRQMQLLVVVCFLAFAFHSLLFLQFTVVAGALGFSGFLLILLYYQNQTVTRPELFFAYALCIFSLFVRKESFFLITIGFGLISFLEFGVKTTFKILWKGKGWILIIICLLAFVPFYENIQGYDEYIDFNNARSRVLDNPIWQIINPGSIWGKSAYFLENWLFRDNPWVTVEQLKVLKRDLNTFYFDSSYIRKSYHMLYETISHNKFLVGWSVLVGLTHITMKGNERKKILFCVVWLGFFILLSPFLLLHPRVQALFLLMFLGLSIIFYKPKSYLPNFTKFALVGMFVLSSIIHGINIKNVVDQKKLSINGLNRLVDQLPENVIYFMDSESLNLMQLNPKIVNEKEDQLFYLGWNSYHPADDLLLKRLGYRSLHDIIEFYSIHSQGQKHPLIPSYLVFLNGGYAKKVISRNGDFELMYFEKLAGNNSTCEYQSYFLIETLDY